MGLISAGLKSVSGTLKDQWKDYIYCDALDSDVLVARGRHQGQGNDNIITDGSVVSVANGQCMLIVEKGQIVEVCAEPGEFIYNSGTEPSFFAGSFKEGLLKTIETMKERFIFGGATGNDQRVYYFNTKEMMDNKFGTANPIPFRIVDHNIGLDIDVSIRCHGVYSYKIINPVLFYINVCGNVSHDFRREEIESQLKSELLSAMQPAFAKISQLEIRPNEIPGRVDELCQFLNEILSAKWQELRGISIVNVAVNSITLPQEDEQIIKQAQRSRIMKDPRMAAAALVDAQAEAMKAAAANPAGAMTGFMGMNMAQANGGMNAQTLFEMNNQPSVSDAWICVCGTKNQGKFCSECGKPRPGAIRCSHCGWEVPQGQSCPKFCPECGKPFQK